MIASGFSPDTMMCHDFLSNVSQDSGHAEAMSEENPHANEIPLHFASRDAAGGRLANLAGIREHVGEVDESATPDNVNMASSREVIRRD